MTVFSWKSIAKGILDSRIGTLSKSTALHCDKGKWSKDNWQRKQMATKATPTSRQTLSEFGLATTGVSLLTRQDKLWTLGRKLTKDSE